MTKREKSSPQERAAIITGIFGLIVACIGGAFLLANTLIGNDATSPTATGTVVQSATSDVPTPTVDTSAPSSATDCVVTISNPLVSLMSEPDTWSQELIRVNPGEYPTLAYLALKIVYPTNEDQLK